MSERTSDIRLRVSSSDDGVTGIRWQADDAPEPEEQRAEAMLLALWDAHARNAMRIDLWTQNMTIEDMNDFFFQTLLTMADTYGRANGDAEIAGDIKLFARDFAEKASKRERRRQGEGGR
ncbi:MAG: hypothetical protein WD336_12240 [Trueperaceae bacterium]